MNIRTLLIAGAGMLVFGPVSNAEVRVSTEQRTGAPAFKFASVPAPANNDAASQAQFTLVDGERDPNGGELAVLHDGRAPTEEDQPAENFFFRARSDGGRLLLDLGSVIAVKEVSTYSWHTSTRAPQVYELFASDGAADGFSAAPRRGTDPESCGWKRIARVDTAPEGGRRKRPAWRDCGRPCRGILGRYRYLLFDIARTEDRDLFGNTFYSGSMSLTPTGPRRPWPLSAIANRFSSRSPPERKVSLHDRCDGGARFDGVGGYEAPAGGSGMVSEAGRAVAQRGFEAATNVTLRFRNHMGRTPASASRSRINMNSGWFRRD
jgi:hypothetical protein